MKTHRNPYATRSRNYSAESYSHSSASVTPTDSPTGFEMKHPLENEWTLWYFSPNHQRSWEESLREVITFSTVEDFWAVYNHIELASELNDKCDYCLFKKGIKPMWEDPSNCAGGRWVYSADMSKRKALNGLDTNWLEVMLCLIGETFDTYGRLVNGAVVNVRSRLDKIAIWLATSNDEDGIHNIGYTLKSRLGLPGDGRLSFEVHRDNQKRTNSTAIRPKYIV